MITMNRLKHLVILVCTFFYCPVAFVYSNTYYVNTKHRRASDSNDGSYSRPWKTISKGVLKLNAGDTLLVMNGVYEEQIVVKASGTSQRPIYIIAAPSKNVIIKGSKSLLREWRRLEKDVWSLSCAVSASIQRIFLASESYLNVLPFHSVVNKKELGEGTFYLDTTGTVILLRTSRDPNAYITEIPICHTILDVRGNHVYVKGFRFLFSSGYDAAVNVGGEGDVID